MFVSKPGLYEISEEDYHKDCCPYPSLSSSIATTLLEKSPRHAWTEHPRLNRLHQSENKKDFDIGKAAHALLLEGRSSVVIIDAADYKKAEPKAQRDAAYAEGKIPILARKWDDVQAMVRAARLQLAATEDCAEVFDPGFGAAEQTLIWKEDGTWCRARLDWLPRKDEVIYDYKTSGGSANPETWARNQLFGIGKDLQPVHYMAGARAVLGWRQPRFRFVVQETDPPYALSVIEMSPATVAFAEKRWRYALGLWASCLEADVWPGYPAHVFHVEAPMFHEIRWGEREIRDEMIADSGRDRLAMMIDWQSPLGETA